jgi:integrase
MSVRKRTWKNKDGERSAWVVNYVDGTGKGHLKTFATRKEAVDWEARTKVEVKEGRHRPDSESITVREAGEQWIKNGTANGLERTSLDQYRLLLDRHIVPYLGNIKLTKLSTPTVNEFRNRLLEGIPAPGESVGTPRSLYTAKRVVSALSSIVADAQQAGHVSQNVVRGLASRKKKNGKVTQRRKLKVGIDIPTPADVRDIIANLGSEGRRRPLILTALFTGLRGSELRGLRWSDVDLERRELHVHQRADFYNDIGAPKSEAGERTVPLPPMVIAALREWKLACPPGPLGLVFPNSRGKVENHGHIVERSWWPAQVEAGVCTVVKDDDGKVIGEPVRKPRYTGLHSTRHFFASWCINRRQDGGMAENGLPAKVVQERLGHATIGMTMDTYGHLFPRADDQDELAAGEQYYDSGGETRQNIDKVVPFRSIP